MPWERVHSAQWWHSRLWPGKSRPAVSGGAAVSAVGAAPPTWDPAFARMHSTPPRPWAEAMPCGIASLAAVPARAQWKAALAVPRRRAVYVPRDRLLSALAMHTCLACLTLVPGAVPVPRVPMPVVRIRRRRL